MPICLESAEKCCTFAIANKKLREKCCTFAIANKKLRWRVKAAAQHSSSELGSAFTLHFTCTCHLGNDAAGQETPATK